MRTGSTPRRVPLFPTPTLAPRNGFSPSRGGRTGRFRAPDLPHGSAPFFLARRSPLHAFTKTAALA
jgi:hypothetical protein